MGDMVMGMIYTWNDVRGKKVAPLGAQKSICKYMQTAFMEENAIVAALVCGSVNHGDSNRRSDVDVIIVYDYDSSKKAFTCMNEVIAYASRRYVVVAPSVCDTISAHEGLHFNNSEYCKHLKYAFDTGGALKGNIPSLLTRQVTGVSGGWEYMRHKLYSLQKNCARKSTFSREERAHYLQKLIEAPMHVARMVLNTQPRFIDTKTEVLCEYSQFVHGALADDFAILSSIDASYSLELEQQLNNPEYSNYKELLNQIEGAELLTINFIRENMRLLLKIKE